MPSADVTTCNDVPSEVSPDNALGFASGSLDAPCGASGINDDGPLGGRSPRAGPCLTAVSNLPSNPFSIGGGLESRHFHSTSDQLPGASGVAPPAVAANHTQASHLQRAACSGQEAVLQAALMEEAGSDDDAMLRMALRLSAAEAGEAEELQIALRLSSAMTFEPPTEEDLELQCALQASLSIPGDTEHDRQATTLASSAHNAGSSSKHGTGDQENAIVPRSSTPSAAVVAGTGCGSLDPRTPLVCLCGTGAFPASGQTACELASPIVVEAPKVVGGAPVSVHAAAPTHACSVWQTNLLVGPSGAAGEVVSEAEGGYAPALVPRTTGSGHAPLGKNDKVEALYGAEWLPGVVYQLLPDGDVQVLWDGDEPSKSNVPAAQVRRRLPFAKDDAVIALCPGWGHTWFPGRVRMLLTDGRVQVLWDDEVSISNVPTSWVQRPAEAFNIGTPRGSDGADDYCA